jgi:rubredoxin
MTTDRRNIICRECLTQKTAFLAGKYADGINKIWVDEEGKRWNGRVCPVCHQGKAKDNMKKLRETRKNAIPTTTEA